MVWGTRVFDFALQIAATGIGAYLAYVGGARLLNIELETERLQRIKELEEERQQKITLVVNILLIEIRQHKKDLPTGSLVKHMEQHKITTYPTVSYDGLLSSGLFFVLPIKTQDKVRFHYGRAALIETFLTLDREYYQVDGILGGYDPEIKETLSRLRDNINSVIDELESLLPPDPA